LLDDENDLATPLGFPANACLLPWLGLPGSHVAGLQAVDEAQFTKRGGKLENVGLDVRSD
jgi:hypothetical protein